MSPPLSASAGLAAPPRAVGRAGLVILALSLGGFAIGTVEFAAMSLVPYFAADLGVDPATAAQAISAYALGVVIGAPLLAVLGARVPRKTLLVGLMALYGAANLAAALATSWPAFLAVRFLSGLPHGAFFGVAALMAAGLVPFGRRTWAVSMVMLGLTVATLLGVPAASLLAQGPGWRWGFGLAAALGALSAGLVGRLAPADRPAPGAAPLAELGALANPQVLLTLVTGAVGFGGLFAVYTYLANTLQEVTRAPAWAEPALFTVFGLGMVAGTLATGRIADRGLLQTAFGLQLLAFVALLAYPSSVMNLWALGGCIFVVGFGSSMGLALQTHLMDVAGRAQTMAAAMHHAAFNMANALGPWLASLAVARGLGYPSSGYVGAALAAAGLGMLALTAWHLKYRHPRG